MGLFSGKNLIATAKIKFYGEDKALENGVSSVFLVNFSRQVIGSEDSRIR